MKRYIEDIGYVEVTQAELKDLPRQAIYFNSDDEYSYYIRGDEDTIYAVLHKGGRTCLNL